MKTIRFALLGALLINLLSHDLSAQLSQRQRFGNRAQNYQVYQAQPFSPQAGPAAGSGKTPRNQVGKRPLPSHPMPKAAAIHLARLDLPSNPGRYIKTGVTVDKNGYLHVVIQNSSKVKVSGIRVVVGRKTGFGLHEDSAFYLRKALKPDQRISVRTDIHPVTNKTLGSYGAIISTAKVQQ